MIETVVAVILILAAGGLILFYTLPRQARALPKPRPIPSINRLRRAVGLAVENGKRIHISLGKSSVINPTCPSALAGLNIAERLTSLSMVSDRPPVTSSGEGTLAILSQDAVRSVYRAGNAIERYEPERARLTGATPFSYIVGTIPVIHEEQITAHVFIGNFGPEVALLTEATEREKAFTLAASDSLPAQAVLYATVEDVLIGEELFAAPAYLNPRPAHLASLRAVDILRWVIILLTLVAIILQLVGSPIL